jgi:hypothetical protein
VELELSADDLAFRDMVRAFLDARLTPDLAQAGRRMTSVFSDKVHSLAWQKILHAQRLGRAVLAGGARRSRLERDPTPRLRRRMRPGRRAQPGADGAEDGGAGHHAVRDAGPAGPLPAPHPVGRGLLVPGLFRARRGFGPGLAVAAGRQGRRPLRADRLEDLDHSRPVGQPDVLPGREPRPKAVPRPGSPSCCSTWTIPGSASSRSSPWPASTRSTRSSSTRRAPPSPIGWARRTRAGPWPSTCWSSSAAAATRRAWRRCCAACGPAPFWRRATKPTDCSTIRTIAAAWPRPRSPALAIDISERRVLDALAGGGAPGPASSLLKLQGSEALQRLDELAVDGAGRLCRAPPAAGPRGRLQPGTDRSRARPDHHGPLPQQPRRLDLRRLQRDPARHHRPPDPGAVGAGCAEQPPGVVPSSPIISDSLFAQRRTRTLSSTPASHEGAAMREERQCPDHRVCR